jgi:hypothetical protein
MTAEQLAAIERIRAYKPPFYKWMNYNPADAIALLDALDTAQQRIAALETALRLSGPIDWPLMEIWDTAHSASIVVGHNPEAGRLLQKIAHDVDKARKALRAALKGATDER